MGGVLLPGLPGGPLLQGGAAAGLQGWGGQGQAAGSRPGLTATDGRTRPTMWPAGLGRAGAGCRIGTWTHSNRWAHKAHNVACRAGEGWGRLQDLDLDSQQQMGAQGPQCGLQGWGGQGQAAGSGPGLTATDGRTRPTMWPAGLGRAGAGCRIGTWTHNKKIGTQGL